MTTLSLSYLVVDNAVLWYTSHWVNMKRSRGDAFPLLENTAIPNPGTVNPETPYPGTPKLRHLILAQSFQYSPYHDHTQKGPALRLKKSP